MIDDEDQTPPQPPMRLENVPVLAVLSDMVLALHTHTKRMRELAREVRLTVVPITPAIRVAMADEIESYHAAALDRARRLREIA